MGKFNPYPCAPTGIVGYVEGALNTAPTPTPTIADELLAIENLLRDLGVAIERVERIGDALRAPAANEVAGVSPGPRGDTLPLFDRLVEAKLILNGRVNALDLAANEACRVLGIE